MKSIITEKNFIEIDLEMSNFDHRIDDRLADKLKSGKFYVSYTAWNFFGKVWWDSNRIPPCFICEIWRYGEIVNYIYADNLKGIMDEACDLYGGQ